VAETFVDPDYAQATCYKATNWQPLGLSAGSGRHARDFYQKHDRPKTLWAIELVKGARQLLADPGPLPAECRAGVNADAVRATEASPSTCKGLMEVFAQLPDPRARSGRRYPLKQLLGILALGMLCGCRDLQAIVLLGQSLGQRQLIALGGWRCKRTNRYEAPSYGAYYNLIGKMERGTRDKHGYRLELIALIENKTQRLVAQQPTDVLSEAEGDKQEGELTAGRRLPSGLPSLENATVTADAMFTHADIARTIVQEKGGDYLLALKDNQPTLHKHVTGCFEAKHPGASPPLFGKVR